MDQTRRPTGVLALTLIAIVAVAACSGAATTPSAAPAASAAAASAAAPSVALSPSAASAAPAANMTSCYLTISANSPYSSPEDKTIHDYGATKGLTVDVLSAESDAPTQANQMSDCIAKKVGIIMLTAVDAKAICSSLPAAKAAGIPVLAVSASVDKSCADQVVATSGPDYCAQAKAAATYVDQRMNKQGNIAIVMGLLGFSATIARTDCFIQQLTDEGSKIKVLAKEPADFDQAKALAVTRDLLTKYGSQLNLIYAMDDGSAAGAAQAIDQGGFTGKIKLMSCGGGTAAALQLIKDGKLEGTVYQSPITDGQLAVDTALQILAGQTVPAFIPLPNPIVNPDNVSQYQPAY